MNNNLIKDNSSNSVSPFISVVMPVYNAKIFLNLSVESVLLQEYENFELLIIDNQSTDGSWDILKDLESKNEKIRIFRTNQNSGGPAAPRNIGILKSKGEYIAFIDSDDLWQKNKLSVQVSYLSKYHFVCTLADKIDDKENVFYKYDSKADEELNLCSLIKKNQIVTSTVLVSKKIMLGIMFDEDKYLNAFEDYNAYMRYLSDNTAILVGKSLAFYRVDNASLGMNYNGKDRLYRSIYCLLKTCIAINNFNCIINGIFVRLRSYYKNLLISSLNFNKKL
mgnify:CR=1 FL=1